MGDRTAIEWTDATWNPLRGCSRVSEGCRHCYAERTAARFAGPGQPFEGFVRGSGIHARWTGHVELIDAKLSEPKHWKRSRRIFVNSMSDLFHPEAVRSMFDSRRQIDARDSPAGQVFDAMIYGARHHTYQLLTKRPETIRPFLESRADGYCLIATDDDERLPEMLATGDFDHMWFGTSVENRAALARIDQLRRTPGLNLFLSIEPLLEDLGTLDLAGIGWVIVGGESGPGARPMHPDWVRAIRDQCIAAGLPFFFKQWGSFRLGESRSDECFIRWQDGFEEFYGDHQDIKYGDHWLEHTADRLVIAYPWPKHRAGRTLDGRTWDEMPVIHHG